MRSEKEVKAMKEVKGNGSCSFSSKHSSNLFLQKEAERGRGRAERAEGEEGGERGEGDESDER